MYKPKHRNFFFFQSNAYIFIIFFLFFRKFSLLKSYAPKKLKICPRIFLLTFKAKKSGKLVKIRFTVCGIKKKIKSQLKKTERNFVNNHMVCTVYEYGNDIVMGVTDEALRS